MIFSKHWERWCKISIAKYFDSKKQSTYLFVEGFERQTEGLREYFELRMDGPNIRQLAKEQWRLYFEVNVLITVQQTNTNAWRPTELTGIIQEAFAQNILVKRYGTGPDDDQGLLGCLTLVIPRAGGEKVQTSDFGMINPAQRIMQATVEGHYEIHLD